LKVSFEASAGFKLQDVSLNGELFDTLVVAKTLGGTGYRYGFNSMEKDDEVKGKGNATPEIKANIFLRYNECFAKQSVAGELFFKSI
ncbi:MAG TPA: hypothetical protein VL021_10595, partial [Brumimicrobium sp.]|nr:hypothetical protein [Brumimicrobium sp.]